MQPQNLTANGVFDDLSSFRAELRIHTGDRYLALLRLNVWLPVLDIMVDWLAIAAMVALVVNLGWWFWPLAVLVIANRQRALGNILHDAGHRNLHRSRRVNDTLAAALVAPLVFADLDAYRDSHFRHHLRLGSDADPDKLARPMPGSWVEHYRTHLLSAPSWWGSVVGHLASSSVSGWRKLYIVTWWALACWAIWALAGARCLGTFLALWMLARATAFHAITTFREMCDHYGLKEGGVISFTRDIVAKSAWRHLVHPRNNGYHLTHHLLPAIPYYKLPQAQRLFATTPAYREQCCVCDSYMLGEAPAVRRWSSEV